MTTSPIAAPRTQPELSLVPGARPRVRGRFLEVGGAKLHVRGVTYGPFGASPNEYPDRIAAGRDFALMARHGINAIRTYTPPPRWLLDAAHEHGVWVLAGLCGERQVGYWCDGRVGAPSREWLAPAVRELAGHPALLGFVVANELPASLVRWLGRHRTEARIEELCTRVRELDPEALVTYCNYPTTEYLELPSLDFTCFNVYLEQTERLTSYLARLHNLSNERPLIMGEMGLDSLRNGEARQAELLGEQIRASFASGCAGVFAYAWSDQWNRGQEDVTDWAFGLTARDRSPKPALAAVERAYAEVPVAPARRWPRISVVVCSYNGSRTIRDCLSGVAALDYPDYEIIVVDDGSKDSTAAIAAEFDCRLIRTENRGLSNARNTGIAAATGEIVAFTDDDARPDPHWLRYLAVAFEQSTHSGIGGPNIPPPGDGFVANCVSASPGGPTVVLVTDTQAEHIPGCNMAFRKTALEAVGGFDARFRTAGDDVDLCWRLMDAGFTLGFHPGAMVWHHSRGSVRTFWRQQVGYGRAESLLERKWPERFNGAGQAGWTGRIYGGVALQRRASHRSFVYQGPWGTAPYQFLYEPAEGRLASFTHAPEWYLLTAALLFAGSLGILWSPLQWALPLAVLALAIPLTRALQSGLRAIYPDPAGSGTQAIARRALTASLHLVQPAARLFGRLRHGLTFWRMHGARRLALPWPRTFRSVQASWRSNSDRLTALSRELREAGALVRHGGDLDRWDLEVWGGALGAARSLMAVEDMAQGRQLLRVRVWPRVPRGTLMTAGFLAALALVAVLAHEWIVSAVLFAGLTLLLAWTLRHVGAAQAALLHAVRAASREKP